MNYTEEKKSIKILNTFKYRNKTKNYKELTTEDCESAEIVLNLIEKQEKEIENLNNKYIHEKVAKEELEEISESSVSKEAIREKIEKLEKVQNNQPVQETESTSEGIVYRYINKIDYDFAQTMIKILKELLGE